MGDIQLESIRIFTHPCAHRGKILVYLPIAIRYFTFVGVKDRSHRSCPFLVAQNEPNQTTQFLYSMKHHIHHSVKTYEPLYVGCPERGVPLVTIHFGGMFPNHPAIGNPQSMEPPHIFPLLTVIFHMITIH